MVKPLPFLIILLWAFAGASLHAQETDTATTPKYWETTFGFGLDVSELFQLNPKQGAGQNRIGIGGAITFAANYQKNRFEIENLASWQFGIQKLGFGTIPGLGEDVGVPFQKSIDELRLTSKSGYRIRAENPKLFLSSNFTFFSQLAPSYPGPDEYPGNLLKNVADTITNSQFFSPATITFSVGIEYKPSPQLSFFYSPIGAKLITVSDDAIAALGVHGNPVTRNEQGEVIAFENTDAQMGSLLRTDYQKKFWEERASLKSTLLLYSNYLNNPQNIDVDWNNEFAVTLIQNLQASLLVNVFYDDDVLVQITDLDAPNGVSGVGKRVSITQQLLLKYSVEF